MKDESVEEILRLFYTKVCKKSCQWQVFCIEIVHLSSHILHLGSSHIDIQQNTR